MKKLLIALLIALTGVFHVSDVKALGLIEPENIRIVVDDEQEVARLIWTDFNSGGDVEGYDIELINEPAGTTETYQIVDDTDGNLDNQATISLASFADDALLKLRIKATSTSLGDSIYSDEVYLKKFPQSYTEDFNSLTTGSITNQNGWNTQGTNDFQIVDISGEEGNVLQNIDSGHTFTENQTTQGSTGNAAKIRIRHRRVNSGGGVIQSPVIWLHGQGDRLDSAQIDSPRYGLTLEDDFGPQFSFKVFDDNDNVFSPGVRQINGINSSDFLDWHYLELEAFATPNGMQLRGSIYNILGEFVDQVSYTDTNNWVPLDAVRGFYGISSFFSNFDISEVKVWADDFRVPPSAPTSLSATPLEGGIAFNWDESDFGGAESPEGKYELLFEQIGGGVTTPLETTDTTYTFTDLNPEAQYRLTVQAVNDEFESPLVTSANATPGTDQTKPVISNTRVTYVDNGTKAGSFRVTWTTDEDTRGRVTYGFQNESTLGEKNSNFSDTGNIFGTTHTTTLTKLAPCTKYRGRIRVRDEADNIGTTPINFTTRGCVGNTEIEEETNDDVSSTEEKEIELREDTRLQAKLRVPQNASTRPNLNFQIKRLVKETFIENVEIPDTLEVIAEVVNLSALEDEDSNVSEFDEPIEITIAYDDTDLTPEEEQELVIYRYGAVEWFECEPSGDCIPDGEEGFEGIGDREGFWTPGEEWEQLSDCTVDVDENTVTCATTRFSSFTVMRLLGGGGDETPTEESPTEETPDPSDTNQDANPQDISDSIPEDQPNTFTNRPFASLSRAVSSRNLALNVIEEEAARTNNSEEEDGVGEQGSTEQDEERTKRDDQTKVAEEISNIEQDLRENPRTRWYLGITLSGILLLAIAVAWMSQRRKM